MGRSEEIAEFCRRLGRYRARRKSAKAGFLPGSISYAPLNRAL